MGTESSQTEAFSLFNFFFESHMDEPGKPHKSDSSDISQWLAPTATVVVETTIIDQSTHITPAPELRIREPVPQADCQALSQSAQQASQSAQQAIQQASDSIQQASQQASQSAAAASRSASEAIQQATQSAQQSISAASRSAASAISSASSAISSIQASAANAISQANAAQSSAQQSASSAQVDASKAVLQAGAAVAAATGKAAQAGSSFLAAAAKATESADASVSAFGAAAASQISQASQQVTASQTQAVTATQAAVAIVGSIIASTLITILIYFLITRHREKAKRNSRSQQSPGNPRSSPDTKFPVSDQIGTTIAESQSRSQSAYPNPTLDPGRSSQGSFSLFPRTTASENPLPRSSIIKTTSVPWNPSNPPKAPSLGSWLKLQDGVSPFGPIKLPTDEKSSSPLGGQLKSPLRNIERAPSPLAAPKFVSPLPMREPRIPNLMVRNKDTNASSTIKSVPTDLFLPTRQDSVKRKPVSPERSDNPEVLRDKELYDTSVNYRESKASVWTDDVVGDAPSPNLPSPPPQPVQVTATKGYSMQIPSPKKPIRTTAEWLQDQQRQQATPSPGGSPRNSRPEMRLGGLSQSGPRLGVGLPNGPRGAMGQVRSMTGEVGYVRGLSRFLDPRDSMRDSGRVSGGLNRYPSDRSAISTPGVGKAL